jgi:hypothetical protein
VTGENRLYPVRYLRMFDDGLPSCTKVLRSAVSFVSHIALISSTE